MENKRELNMDEMDRVAGGKHDDEENRREYGRFPCPHCGKVCTSDYALREHIKETHT